MFNMIYIFNFCDYAGMTCHDSTVAAYEVLEVN